MGESRTRTAIYALLGLNRVGRILYGAGCIAGIAALVLWNVWWPRARFSDEDERMFRAARHGDLVSLGKAIAAGAGVNDASPVDGKTALFRAAVFGHADAIRLLLEEGADPDVRGFDGRSVIEVVERARAEERNPESVRALAAVVEALQGRGVVP